MIRFVLMLYIPQVTMFFNQASCESPIYGKIYFDVTLTPGTRCKRLEIINVVCL